MLINVLQVIIAGIVVKYSVIHVHQIAIYYQLNMASGILNEFVMTATRD